MDIANGLGEGRAIGQPPKVFAIREFELIDVHGAVIAPGNPVQAERVVEVMVADAAVEQWTRRVLEPARPAFVWQYDPHVGNELKAVEGDRLGQRHEPLADVGRFVHRIRDPADRECDDVVPERGRRPTEHARVNTADSSSKDDSWLRRLRFVSLRPVPETPRHFLRLVPAGRTCSHPWFRSSWQQWQRSAFVRVR
jgi:hypothetical protein